jgi:hypothetical protein
MAPGDWGRSKPPKAKRAPSIGKASRAVAYRELDAFMAAGQWESAKAVHFVAYYAACHERVYGFAPHELDSAKTFALARFAASRMLKDHFGGDATQFQRFFKWAWLREAEREEWRRKNGKDGSRIGWRWQFNAELVSEYRLAMARRSK